MEIKDNLNKDYLPLRKRKAFPLCLWFKGYDIDVENLEEIIKKRCEILFEKEEFEIFIIRGSHEKDKVRIFSPDINLDCSTIKDLRNFILEGLGIYLKSCLIPTVIYDLDVDPDVYKTEYLDIGSKKKFKKTFECLNKKIESKEICKMLNKALEYDDQIEKTKLTDTYLEYVEQKEDAEDDIIFKISENIKSVSGKDFQVNDQKTKVNDKTPSDDYRKKRRRKGKYKIYIIVQKERRRKEEQEILC